MYYITSQTNQIIAADSSLLKLLSLETIDDLYTKIALGEIDFSSVSKEKMTITTSQGEDAYSAQQHSLSGILGEMTLVNITKEENPVLDILKDEEPDEPMSLLDDGTPFIKNDTEIDISNIATNDTSIDQSSNDAVHLLDTDSVVISESSDTKTIDDTKDDTLIDLDAPVADKEKKVIQDTSPIIIDAEKISREIGISPEDYNNFLNEYIDTALKLEDDLRSTKEEKRSEATITLSHLSNVLHLSVITEIIKNINDSENSDQNNHIDTLYSTLTRLTTNKDITVIPIDDMINESIVEDKPSKIIVAESFGAIDLSNVKPIYFDFQMEEAANDLSLPVELIEEFVQDFIVQADEETENMLAAYKKGDLETIQKIGHMLKGASSNLRIKALSDTLYKIQFCEKHEELEDLIKDYWGHFLAFKTKIDLASQ